MLDRFRHSIVFIIVFFTIGGSIFGYELSIIASAAPFIRSSFHLTTVQLSTLMGLILLGGIMSKAIIMFADFLGRRNLIIFTFFIYIIGFLIFTHSHSYAMLSVGRLIQGASMTLNAVIFNVYLAEISPKKIRGRVILAQQLSFTAGILLAGIVSLGYVKSGNWEGMFNCILFLPIILFFFSFLLPQSPRCLALKGKLEEAKTILRKINKKLTKEQLELECEELVFDHKKDSSVKEKLKLYLNKKYIKPILIVLALYVLDQLTGVKAIFQTSVVILNQTGISSTFVGVLGSIFITGMNFVMTIVTLIYIDKLGRKKILKIGIAGFAISTLIMGLILFLLPTGNVKGWVMLIGLVVAIGFYAFGPSAVIGVLASEIIPNRARSIGLVICGLIANIVGMIFVSQFLIIAKDAGYGILFTAIAISAIIFFIFALKVVPETRGKSLEEIESGL
ncbi:MAG TPA: sugar porter family MFS transporter [Victivallales bacterium]|nr:sugar porter family MFS transporter [Victivallales bacterium]